MEQFHDYYPVCTGRRITIFCKECKEQWHLKIRWLLLLNIIGFSLPVALIIYYFRHPFNMTVAGIILVALFFIGQLVPPPLFCFFLRKSKNIEKYLNQSR